MKRPTQEQLRKKHDVIAIAVIKGLLQKDKIKEAIETAEKRNFTPEQFGQIARLAELPAEEIYKRVF